MTPEQIEEIRKTIKDNIQLYVNGKIDRLSIKLDNHVEKHEEQAVMLKWLVRILGGIGSIMLLAFASALATKIV